MHRPVTFLLVAEHDILYDGCSHSEILRHQSIHVRALHGDTDFLIPFVRSANNAVQSLKLHFRSLFSHLEGHIISTVDSRNLVLFVSVATCSARTATHIFCARFVNRSFICALTSEESVIEGSFTKLCPLSHSLFVSDYNIIAIFTIPFTIGWE